MTVVTTVRPGQWSDPFLGSSPWPGGILPTASDWVQIDHPLVWDQSFQVDGMLINATVTTSGTGHTFVTGPVIQGNVGVTIGPGNTLAGVP